MSNILDMSAQYRCSGNACRAKLKEVSLRLERGGLRPSEMIELRRRKTMLSAMTRECIATANYLEHYHERREKLEKIRQQTGV